MFKRIVLALGLILVFALPASAEVKGIYGGLKFIDSIQSTGDLSRGDYKAGLGSHSQNTVGGGIFVGFDFYPQMQVPLRAEIEYAIRTNMDKTYESAVDEDGGFIETKAKWNVQTLFANLYYDFRNSTAFTPYVGAGLGLGFINNSYKTGGHDPFDGYEEWASKSKTNTVFAWNVGVGCSYAFNENFSADLAYRFVGLGYNEVSTRMDDGTKLKIGTSPYMNEFSLGLRFTF